MLAGIVPLSVHSGGGWDWWIKHTHLDCTCVMRWCTVCVCVLYVCTCVQGGGTCVCVCAQILRAMIHNEIMRIDPELKENEPEKYRR